MVEIVTDEDEDSDDADPLTYLTTQAKKEVGGVVNSSNVDLTMP
jgi:hypothetical protein